MNMPASLMWARTFEIGRCAHFVPPRAELASSPRNSSSGRRRWTFTAPNLHYLLDSPTELGRLRSASSRCRSRRSAFTFRTALHPDATEEADAIASGAEKIVSEADGGLRRVPQYETGTYTFLADYLPRRAATAWSIATAPSSLDVCDCAARRLLETVSHEFFHCWNVERIRPQGLEPFDFERPTCRASCGWPRASPSTTDRWHCSAPVCWTSRDRRTFADLVDSGPRGPGGACARPRT